MMTKKTNQRFTVYFGVLVTILGLSFAGVSSAGEDEGVTTVKTGGVYVDVAKEGTEITIRTFGDKADGSNNKQKSQTTFVINEDGSVTVTTNTGDEKTEETISPDDVK